MLVTLKFSKSHSGLCFLDHVMCTLISDSSPSPLKYTVFIWEIYFLSIIFLEHVFSCSMFNTGILNIRNICFFLCFFFPYLCSRFCLHDIHVHVCCIVYLKERSRIVSSWAAMFQTPSPTER